MEELVRKSKHGDIEAFTSLISLVEADLYRIAKLRLDNTEDIFDAIQETMIVAFNSISKLKEEQYFKTWIIRILMNQSNKIYNKNKKHSFLISLETINNSTQLSDSVQMDTVDMLLDFEFMCKNLKYEDRLIIILYYMENFTDAEIGRILSLKESTITTKRTRAKKKIQNILNARRK